MKKMKHILATVLSFTLVFASLMTVSAMELSNDTSVETLLFESKSQQEIFYVKGNGIALRSQPSLSSTRVGLLYESKDDWIMTNHNRVGADGEIWYEVVSSSIGYKGWIAERYLDIP